MITRVYTPDRRYDPSGVWEPVIVDLPLAEAIAVSEGGFLTLWTDRGERLGEGFRVPGAYTHFHLHGALIRNPWACFLPLPAATVPEVGDLPSEPSYEEENEKLFEQFELSGLPGS